MLKNKYPLILTTHLPLLPNCWGFHYVVIAENNQTQCASCTSSLTYHPAKHSNTELMDGTTYLFKWLEKSKHTLEDLIGLNDYDLQYD